MIFFWQVSLMLNEGQAKSEFEAFPHINKQNEKNCI